MTTMPPSWLEPFWSSPVMRAESLFFVAPARNDSGEGVSTARLLFQPDEVPSLTSVDGAAYELDRDFIVDSASGLITLPAGSRVPFTTHEELYLPVDPLAESIMSRRDDPDTCLLCSDEIFHRRQVLATYMHAPGVWRGYAPTCALAQLPRTQERLRTKASVTLCVAGDSISEGYNASGFMRKPPYQAPYGELVAGALESVYGSPVTFHNCAVAGHTTDNGIWESDQVGALRPDLVILAYGMNDLGYLDDADFSRNIARMMADIRRHSADAEFVLVSSMLPHPEWDYPIPGRLARYRDQLSGLCGEGAVLSDLTALWTDLLTRKSGLDLSGNGINHPNDFGHRLYAQVILALLVELDVASNSNPRTPPRR